MNCRQLIDELQKFDGDAEVAIVDSIDDYAILDSARLVTGRPCSFDKFVALISTRWEDYQPEVLKSVRES